MDGGPSRSCIVGMAQGGDAGRMLRDSARSHDWAMRVLVHRARTASAPGQRLLVQHRCTIPRCTHPNSP